MSSAATPVPSVASKIIGLAVIAPRIISIFESEDIPEPCIGVSLTLAVLQSCAIHTSSRVSIPWCFSVSVIGGNRSPSPGKYKHNEGHCSLGGSQLWRISFLLSESLYISGLLSTACAIHSSVLAPWLLLVSNLIPRIPIRANIS